MNEVFTRGFVQSTVIHMINVNTELTLILDHRPYKTNRNDIMMIE